MDSKISIGAFAVLAFFSVVLAGFAASSPAIAGADFYKLFSIDGMTGFLSSPEFIFLALAFPLPLAVASASAHLMEKIESYFAAMLGALPAVIVSLLLFGFGVPQIIIALSLCLGMIALIEVSHMKKAELKTLVTLRTARAGAKAAIFIIALGVFAAGSLVALENNEANLKKLEENLVSATLGQQDSSGGANVSKVLAQLIVNSHKQVINDMMQTPQFSKLREKSDPDVQAFVASTDLLSQSIDSEENIEKVAEEVKKKSENVSQVMSLDFLRKQNPAIDALAENLWLVHGIGTASIFLFLANLIAANLAGIYAAAIRMAWEAIGQAVGLAKEQ